MSKIGLMGGSFDPIHLGHTELVQLAMEQLSLDSFVLIPVANNPWKTGSRATKEQRLKMIQLAISSLNNVSIDTIELDCDTLEKNYTINTLKKLREKYPHDTLYFIMGMDQASQFHKWKSAREISEIVQLVAFNRLGYQANETMETYNFITLKNVPSAISSSAIREGDITSIDPLVLSYIANQGIYLETLLKNKMSQKRFIHTKSMANLAKEIALANDIDEQKAYIAGMFHDIAKEMPMEEARQLMETHFQSYLDKPIPIWHQWLSKYVASETYGIKDVEILQAIRHHTTASIRMSKLDMCIYVADKYDQSRNYDASKEIQLCKENIVAGFKQCLKDFYVYSKEQNRNIDSYFYEVYSTYIKEKLNE